MNENHKKYIRDIIMGIQVRLEDIFKFNFKFGIGRLVEMILMILKYLI